MIGEAYGVGDYKVSNGRHYSQGTARAWYPAPGYRDAGNLGKNGALMNVGYCGFSWSRSVSGPNGLFLDFYTQSLNPSGGSSRGYGFQVRCLQE